MTRDSGGSGYTPQITADYSAGSACTSEITADHSEAEESLWGSRPLADREQRTATSVDGDETAYDTSDEHEPISAQEFVDLLRAKHLLPNLLSEEAAKEVRV
jgi:hypothetical protein